MPESGNEPLFDTRRRIGARSRTVLQPSPRLFPVDQRQTGTDDRYTPPWIFERMNIRFDLDVAAPPGGVEWIPADHHYSEADDGLMAPWHGRVWMNPPFSNCGQWSDRFIAHRHGVALIQVTRAAHSYRLWGAADAIVIPSGNLQFVVTDDAVDGDRRYRGVFMPCWLAAFGDECVDAIRRVGTVRKVG